MVTWSTTQSQVLNPELHVSDDLITGPTIEPIDLDEFKKHIKFTPTSEDTLIDTYIAMARQYFEEHTGIQLMAATWERRVEAFPSAVIELSHPPLLEIVSVTYADGDGADQVLVENTDYVVYAPRGLMPTRGLIRPAYNTSWPSARSELGSVRIRYRAGYGEQPGDVPELVKGILGFLAGYFHQFRSAVHLTAPGGSVETLPLGAQEMLKSFKYSALPTRSRMRAI